MLFQYVFVKDPATKVANAWYETMSKYEFDNPGYVKEAGGFINMIWKATTDLGCGISKAKSHAVYVVCDYTPGASTTDSYKSNVLKE